MNFIGRCVQYGSLVVLATGLGSFMFLNLFHGPTTGAPFNPAAGLMLLAWVFQTPLAMLSPGAALLGGLGLAAGSALVKKEDEGERL